MFDVVWAMVIIHGKIKMHIRAINSGRVEHQVEIEKESDQSPRLNL